jgi:hypothetical protein
MKLTRKILKSLIKEALLLEQSTKDSSLSIISVDDQIDSLLIGFERDSVHEKVATVENYSLLNVMHTLFEQEEKEEDAEGEEPAKADEKAEDEKADEKEAKTSEEVTTDDASAPEQPTLDLNKFAMNVARLHTNSVNLLDVSTVIVNRAKNYVEKNYSPDVAAELVNILETQHGVYATGDGPDIPSPPHAERAGKADLT